MTKGYFVKRTPWGYEVWKNRLQLAAGVGIDYFTHRGLAQPESREWRKFGIWHL